MKYLKDYKLFESVNETEIHELCKEFGIKNYTINTDGSVDVEGNVYLYNRNLTNFPLKFGSVSGYFNCSDNNLTSLEGAPQSVGGYFCCNNNNLTSLEGAPQSVAGYFYCSYNNLTSLEGAPQSVGGFYCHNNNLTSLVGAPQSVAGSFYCHNNNLTSLVGVPKRVGGDFHCYNNNLTSLVGAPQSVAGNFSCSYNKLTSLDGLEFKFFKRIDLEKNPVHHLVKDWINLENRLDLIEYFVDLSVIQDGNKLSMMRLEAFYEDMGLEMKIDFNEVKKYYEIIE
jgi:hypothetical protein